MNERHSIIPAVFLMLIRDEKILLIRRFNTGYMDGNYSLPAGHVEKGEFATEALVREMKEELGITIQPNHLVATHVIYRVKDQERVDFYFTVHLWEGNITNLEPDKCDDVAWFSVTALPDNVVPVVRQAIEHYLAGKIFSEANF